MIQPYAPGQVGHIFKHLDFDPGWFILGGPADADEAQVFKARYPSTSVLGIEPNCEAFAYQQDVGFPGVLLPCALSSSVGTVEFHPNSIRNGSIGLGGLRIESTTLDALDVQYGPFQNAVLWLDIEGHEMDALLGATRLLTEGRIRLMNLEIIEDRCDGRTTLFDRFVNYLKPLGYDYIGDWNVGALSAGPTARFRRDCIFKTWSHVK